MCYSIFLISTYSFLAFIAFIRIYNSYLPQGPPWESGDQEYDLSVFDDGHFNQSTLDRMSKLSLFLGPLLTVATLPVTFSDTCGQDRIVLGNWFISHGSPNLLLEPRPKYVGPVNENPYENPDNPPDVIDENAVCAMRWSDTEVDPETGDKKYYLGDFESKESAEAANFTVTHKGHCAACSYLQDLGVYIRQNLTSETRRCGMMGSISHDLMRSCLLDLGFSLDCVTIWEWNIINTKDKCFTVCMWSWITNEPFNKPDGSLNDCLQCDEDLSGPNFKFFSGRTRRNSGITSAIWRPPETIYPIEHCYWYGDLPLP